MNLTMQILQIILPMKKAFVQQRTFQKFLSAIFAILCVSGRHTITAILYFLKMENQSWSSIYRLFSRAKWDPEDCFDELFKATLKKALNKCKNEILISLDDFKIDKTGKCIPHARYQLDPKSPRFLMNFVWGHRYLHATFVVYRKKRGKWLSAKSISIKLKLAPHIKKPGKRATEEDKENYKKEKAEHNLSQYTIELMKELRKICDDCGYANKPLFIVADGGYCNKTIMRSCPKNVELILRCRKDAKLCDKSDKPKKFYSENKFTPHDIYKNTEIPKKIGCFFYGRNTRRMNYKQKLNIYWQTGAQKRPLRCIVVHGVPYRKKKTGIPIIENRCICFLLI